MAADAIDHAIQLLNNGLAIVGDNARPTPRSATPISSIAKPASTASARLKRREKCAEKVFALEPSGGAGFRLRAGSDWLLRGLTQDAVRNLKKAVERDPNDVDTLLLLCNCYLISKGAGFAAVDRTSPDAGSADALTRCLPGFADVSEGIRAASSRTGRCSRWIRTTRWRGCSTPGSRCLEREARLSHYDLEGFPAGTRDSPGAPRTLPHALSGRTREGSVCDTRHRGSCWHERRVREIPRGRHTRSGASEPAIHWLSVAVDHGYINYPFLARHDPCLESVRSHPEFLRLMDTKTSTMAGVRGLKEAEPGPTAADRWM